MIRAYTETDNLSVNGHGETKGLLARGLEPPRVSPYGPEPYASANSATRAKPVVLTMHGRRKQTRKSRRAFLPCASLQLVSFAYLAKRAQKVRIIGYNDLVILQGLVFDLFPILKRSLIKLRRFGVIAARMIDDRQIAF